MGGAILFSNDRRYYAITLGTSLIKQTVLCNRPYIQYTNIYT